MAVNLLIHSTNLPRYCLAVDAAGSFPGGGSSLNLARDDANPSSSLQPPLPDFTSGPDIVQTLFGVNWGPKFNEEDRMVFSEIKSLAIS